MRPDPGKPSGGGVAAVAVGIICLLLPVLYVLSVGPASQFYAGSQPPPWVLTFYAPIEYLANTVPLFAAVLEWYIDFWR